MKKVKKSLLLIGIVLATILALLCLASCDMLSNVSGGSNGGSSSGKNSKNTKTAKVDLAEAAENFEKMETKRTDISIDFNGSLFIQQKKQQDVGLEESYNICTVLDLTRIQERDKIFLKSSVDLDEAGTDEQVSGLFGEIIKNIDTFSSFGKSNQSELTKYLNTIHHFLIGQVDAEASLGYLDGTYNLKAGYNDTGAKASNDIWFVADEIALLAWLNNMTKMEVSNDQLNNIMMKTIFAQLNPNSAFFEKDLGNKYIDDKGKAEYEIKIKTDAIITSSIISALLEFVGVNDKNSTIGQYKNYFSDIQNWFSLKIDNVSATVKDSLPLNVKTGITVDLNIDVEKVASIIDELQRDKVIDDVSARRTRAIFIFINKFLCGTNGEERKIGIRFDVDIEENFLTDASKCNLSSSKYSDYFIGIDESPEGRVDLRNVVAGIIENVDSYIDSYLKVYAKALGEEYTDEIAFIREKIMEKVNELRDTGVTQITIEQMEEILTEILNEYIIDDPEQSGSGDDTPESGSDKTINGEKAKRVFDRLFDSLGEKNN